MRFLLAGLKDDESGATLIEYGLISALVGITAIVVLGELGSSVASIFDAVNVHLTLPSATP
jgi:pilus assembly protein Flp/PilA